MSSRSETNDCSLKQDEVKDTKIRAALKLELQQKVETVVGVVTKMPQVLTKRDSRR